MDAGGCTDARLTDCLPDRRSRRSVSQSSRRAPQRRSLGGDLNSQVLRLSAGGERTAPCPRVHRQARTGATGSGHVRSPPMDHLASARPSKGRAPEQGPPSRVRGPGRAVLSDVPPGRWRTWTVRTARQLQAVRLRWSSGFCKNRHIRSIAHSVGRPGQLGRLNSRHCPDLFGAIAAPGANITARRIKASRPNKWDGGDQHQANYMPRLVHFPFAKQTPEPLWRRHVSNRASGALHALGVEPAQKQNAPLAALLLLSSLSFLSPGEHRGCCSPSCRGSIPGWA